jgi:hypothetical protein
MIVEKAVATQGCPKSLICFVVDVAMGSYHVGVTGLVRVHGGFDHRD